MLLGHGAVVDVPGLRVVVEGKYGFSIRLNALFNQEPIK
jgi:hypothetical protein